MAAGTFVHTIAVSVDVSCMPINPVLSAYGTSALHHLVDLALYVKLRVFGLHTFQLDGHFLSNDDVGA